ncbi:MAG: hypothetical protein QGI09_01470 [Dehalococcoidia bacterium]|nr:hypothetical protein [Dehalococcoidia bacterium]
MYVILFIESIIYHWRLNGKSLNFDQVGQSVNALGLAWLQDRLRADVGRGLSR